MNRIAKIFVAGICLFLTSSLSAHDFWVTPSAYELEPDALLAAHLGVGHALVGDVLPRDSRLMSRFVLVGPEKSESPFLGREGENPAGYARVKGAGVYTIGYRSRPSYVELEPEEFEQYLREEGLERIIELREKNGVADQSGREIFSRCAKSIVIVGSDAIKQTEPAKLGFRLEIIPESSLHDLQPGDELTVQVLYEDKPCPGLEIDAETADESQPKITHRTDANGRAVFKLPTRGPWIINAVHMVEETEIAVVDWESLWASLTFQLRPKIEPNEAASP